MKIVFASDHAGFALKNALVSYVRDELGYEVMDAGPENLDPMDDYPVFIKRATKEVVDGEGEVRVIILGGSGQGEAMQANRFVGVRAAVFYGGAPDTALDIIRLSREHNDANILSFGARFVSEEEAKDAVRLWLSTEKNPEEKYARRIRMMDEG